MDAAATAPHNQPAAPAEGASVLCEAKPSAVKEDTIVNRETKLALLIGFVAIVVVTVLVGEHFGKARNATPATTDLGTSTAAAPATTGLTVDPITATPVATPSAPLAPPATGGSGSTVQPVILSTGPALTSAGAASNGSTPVGGGSGAANANVFMPAAGIDTVGGNAATPAGFEVPGTQPMTTLGNNPGNPALGGKPISTGVEKMHPVQRGETLATLAQKYYGDKSFSKQLGTYNAKRLSANGTVREGVTLRIPPKDVLTGAAVLSPTSAGHTEINTDPRMTAEPKAKTADKAKAEKSSPEKAKATGARTYVIKKGDTLMTIASKELGSAKRWESLLAANPGLDENSLMVGRSIKIPATK